ncbi:unnamed protein product, partial [Brassica oleracea var. botrytis]
FFITKRLVHCLIESILSVIFEKRTNMVVYESSIRNLSLFHIVNMILCFFKAMEYYIREFILSFLAIRLFSYQSVANQYHKHVLKTLAFSWIWMSFANIDRSSIIGDAIYYLNELLQRINDLHNELESTPLGFLPQVCSCWDKGRLKDSKHVIDLMKKLYCSTVKREEILSFPLIYKKSFRGKIWISERVFFVFCRKESTGRLMSFFINSPDSHRLMTPGCRALPLANDGSYSTVWPALSLVSPRSSTVVLSSISPGFFR